MQPTTAPFWQGQLAESLIQSINVWVNVCDRDLNILLWNPTAERICGYLADEVVGNPYIWDWLYPDLAYRQSVLDLTSHVLVESGNITDVETQITCKNGDEKIIAWYSRPLVSAAGWVQGFVTFGNDVTDKRRAENALQKAHNELHVLYEIASITNEITNLRLILERSLDHILRVMKSSAGAMHIWDDEARTLIPAAQQGIQPTAAPQDSFIRAVYDNAQYRYAAPEDPESFVGVPMRAKGEVRGVISILVRATAVSQDDIALLTSIADQIGIAVENARLYQQSRQLAVAEERRRLARDLHDSVTQSLYSLTLFAEAGQRLLRSGEPERAEKYLHRVNVAAQDALKEMRLLLYELRPWKFETGKLVETLQHRLDAVERRAGLTAHLITTPLPALTPRAEENLYYIALEGLNNALKHAFATAVTVQLCYEDAVIRLEVRDNGIGFDWADAVQSGGVGLISMRERAEEMGGSLTFEFGDGAENRGTLLRVCVPYRL